MTFSLDFDGENKPMSLYSKMELDFFFFNTGFFFFLHSKNSLKIYILLEIFFFP